MLGSLNKSRIEFQRDWVNAVKNGLSEQALAILPRIPTNFKVRVLIEPSETTPLQLAAFFGMPQVVQALLERGVYINEQTDDKTHYTPLHYALKNLQVEMRKPDSRLIGPLKEVIRVLINHDPSILTVGDYNGMTPIHYASEMPNGIDILKLFIDYKSKTFFDINIVSKTHNTPLHLAARDNSFEIVKLLMSHGANPRALNDDGLMPMDCTNDNEIRRYLRERSINLFDLCTKVISQYSELKTAVLDPEIIPEDIGNRFSSALSLYELEEQRKIEIKASNPEQDRIHAEHNKRINEILSSLRATKIS